MPRHCVGCASQTHNRHNWSQRPVLRCQVSDQIKMKHLLTLTAVATIGCICIGIISLLSTGTHPSGTGAVPRPPQQGTAPAQQHPRTLTLVCICCTGGANYAVKLPKGWSWDQYHSHEEVVSFLTWIGGTYSHVATTASIGQRCAPTAQLLQHQFCAGSHEKDRQCGCLYVCSVQGRELLSVRMTGRKQNKPQPKPKIKVVLCPVPWLRALAQLVCCTLHSVDTLCTVLLSCH
jgi:hypothetical protein